MFYLKSSNIPYSNVHPNIITESVLVTNPSIKETHCINTLCGDLKTRMGLYEIYRRSCGYCFKRTSWKTLRERLLFKYRSFKNVWSC